MRPGDIDCMMNYESYCSSSLYNLDINVERPLLEPGRFVFIKKQKETNPGQPGTFPSEGSGKGSDK
jgi:hypothetical protein